MSREDHLVVWPVLIFVSVIVVLLVLDDALWGFFEVSIGVVRTARGGTRRLCFAEVSGSRDQVHRESIQVSKVSLTRDEVRHIGANIAKLVGRSI